MQHSVQGLVSFVDLCDQKDKMAIRQKVTTKFGWERLHKGKRYKVWTFSKLLGVANEHKFDNYFMTMMHINLVRGIEGGQAWLKARKNLMKISQAKVFFYQATYRSYLQGVLSTMHEDDGIKNITLSLRGMAFNIFQKFSRSGIFQIKHIK